jgi:prevent-host-death family protein
METATITQVKNGLSSYIDKVKSGESILVTDRGVPVAVLEPVAEQVDWDERMARLERAGLVRRGKGRIPLEILRTPGPKVRGPGNPLVDAVIEERRSGW